MVLNIEQSQIQVFLEHRLPSLFILLKITLQNLQKLLQMQTIPHSMVPCNSKSFKGTTYLMLRMLKKFKSLLAPPSYNLWSERRRCHSLWHFLVKVFYDVCFLFGINQIVMNGAMISEYVNQIIDHSQLNQIIYHSQCIKYGISWSRLYGYIFFHFIFFRILSII